MKVLRISTGIFPVPPVAGGAVERYIYHLSNSMARKGIEEHLVGDLDGNAPFEEKVIPHPVGTIRLSFKASFYGWILNFVIGSLLVTRTTVVLLLVRHQRYDLIHGHDLLSTLLLLIIRKIFGSKLFGYSPIVFTIHGSTQRSIMYRGLKGFVSCVGNGLNRFVWNNADHLITLGNVPLNELIYSWRISKQKISAIPPGVDTSFFRPSNEFASVVREKHGVEGRYCLFVGRLSPVKGPQFLLSALRNIDIDCVLVGDGPYRTELERMATCFGISERLTFVGLVSFSETRPIYASAEFFVLPTLKEGNPLVILEAMASGLPIISTRVSGIPDVVRDGYNGFLIDPEDNVALREKILRLTADASLRRRMGENSRRLAVDEFDWDRIAVKTIAVYRKVLQHMREQTGSSSTR